jgi:putative solute:sodium symporter small subunit
MPQLEEDGLTAIHSQNGLPSVPESGGPGRSVAWGPGAIPLQPQHLDPADMRADHGYCQVLVRSLIRAQLGVSLVCLAFALAVTASFPILCAVVPALYRTEIFGLPLVLVALGAGIYPVILLIGFFYNHQASRLEKKFTSLVNRVDGPPADG